MNSLCTRYVLAFKNENINDTNYYLKKMKKYKRMEFIQFLLPIG